LSKKKNRLEKGAKTKNTLIIPKSFLNKAFSFDAAPHLSLSLMSKSQSNVGSYRCVLTSDLEAVGQGCHLSFGGIFGRCNVLWDDHARQGIRQRSGNTITSSSKEIGKQALLGSHSYSRQLLSNCAGMETSTEYALCSLPQHNGPMSIFLKIVAMVVGLRFYLKFSSRKETLLYQNI
jgi:hypothetical protein